MEDLHFHPADLYRRLAAFDDPLEFAARDRAFETLQTGYQSDLARAQQVAPRLATADPPRDWCCRTSHGRRRVSGPWANQLATANPQRAHAVLVRRGDGYTVSVRAPRPGRRARMPCAAASSPAADAQRQLASPPCRRTELERFIAEFQRAFAPD